MKRLTMKSANKAIAARGIKAELVKGDCGYFYFVGDDVEYANTTSVSVYQLNHLTLDQWMADLDSFVADSKKVRKELDEGVYMRIKPQ